MEKKKPNRRSIPVTITIERELLTIIDNLSDAQNMTRSQFIERQIRNGIESEKTMVAFFANPKMATGFAKLFQDPDMLKSMGKAMQEEVTEKQLEQFSRGISTLGEQAETALDSNKKGKGKKK